MKKSDIYEVAIKILGLYLAISVIGMFEELAGSIYIFFSGKNDFENSRSIHFLNLFLTLINWVLYGGFIYILVFKTKMVVRKICSKSDHEENAKLFTDKQTVFEIALLIIGGLMAMWALPDLGYKIYDLVKLLNDNFAIKYNDIGYLIATIIKFVVGLLIFLDAKPLAKYFTKEKKEENQERTE